MLPSLIGTSKTAVTTAQAVMMMNREKAVVIDVCEIAEFSAGHIVGAKNIPLSTLESQLPTSVKNKALPLLMVCQKGSRSQKAIAIAKKLGFSSAHSVEGGLDAWRAAALPIEKS